jgi:hypothetical protein
LASTPWPPLLARAARRRRRGWWWNPDLLQLGLLQRTARWPAAWPTAFEVLGLPPPSHLATIPPPRKPCLISGG